MHSKALLATITTFRHRVICTLIAGSAFKRVPHYTQCYPHLYGNGIMSACGYLKNWALANQSRRCGTRIRCIHFSSFVLPREPMSVHSLHPCLIQSISPSHVCKNKFAILKCFPNQSVKRAYVNTPCYRGNMVPFERGGNWLTNEFSVDAGVGKFVFCISLQSDFSPFSLQTMERFLRKHLDPIFIQIIQPSYCCDIDHFCP